MSKAIGGYIPRSKRRYVQPEPADGIPRCDSCRARLDLSMWPHFCKEITYGTPLLSDRLTVRMLLTASSPVGENPVISEPWLPERSLAIGR